MSIQFIEPLGNHFPTEIKEYQHTQHLPISGRSSTTTTTDDDSISTQGCTDPLPDDFFAGNSPPPPLSPIHIHSSITNSPVSSPRIHPATPQTPEPMLLDTPHHRLCLDDFEIKQTVGIGSSARVHLAKSKRNNKYYAIKAICKKDVSTKRQLEHVQNERYVSGLVDHPFLVKLWGTFQSETHLFFVMDYVPGGELFTVIHENKLTEDDAKFYAAEVLLGIEYLHQLNIAYRDLKPENILLDHRGHIRMTDFGFAKVLVNDVTWTICGTPDYLAPEIIRNKGYTKAVDWWSFGVLIYEMITGQSPFHAKNPIEQYQKILECDIVWPEYISPEAKDLIENLLKDKPAERYGAADIKSHPWFQTINFDAAYARELTPPFIPDVKFNGDTRYFDYYEEPHLPYHLAQTSKSYCENFPNF